MAVSLACWLSKSALLSAACTRQGLQHAQRLLFYLEPARHTNIHAKVLLASSACSDAFKLLTSLCSNDSAPHLGTFSNVCQYEHVQTPTFRR